MQFKTAREKTRRTEMDTEWGVSFFPGTNLRTTEYLVGTNEGLISCATMRRMSDDKAYDPSCLEEVKANGREYVCDGASTTNPRVRVAVPIPTRPDPEPVAGPCVPRRMRITPSDSMTHGYTVGCPGCEAMQAGGAVKRNHAEECRGRI